MITRIFWSLFAVESAVALYFMFYFFSPRMTRGWGPEGPVGAWLMLLPAVFLALLGAAVLLLHSDKVKLCGIVVMALPLVQIAVGPLYQKWQNHQTDRSLAGDNNFVWPAQRKLAHAIGAHDVARVRSLIPGAGDPNQLHRGQSFLNFAIDKAAKAPGSVEIVQALLNAGANPNHPAYPNLLPLTVAISDSARMTETLLQAGADPNRIDEANRPIWWNALHYDSDERVETLRVLLDHGADITKRDSEGGPVAWATYQAWMSHGANWRIVWLLMERGASWKDEQEFGRSVVSMFQDDYHSREVAHGEISEAMRQIKGRIESELPAQ
ncbi:MAG: ankyrin repeat domain-containing protein [Acidobacteriia bacterium]|nr:ankyrin repeat domain-containing protein [Terriglobia bacterium]